MTFDRVKAARQEAERKMLDAMRIRPNPRIVALLDYALDEVTNRLHDRDKYAEWLLWASSWEKGVRSPGACVDVARKCFADKEDLIGHSLGQLAWAGKEACYSGPSSGWLVIRYIADAMIAFGVAFPDHLSLPSHLSERPHDDGYVTKLSHHAANSENNA